MIALLGTLLASTVHRVFRILPRRQRLLAWGLLLIPFFVPSLITGYCYRDTSMSLVHSPWLRELLYAAIIMFQVTPVAVVLLHFSPEPSVSDSAWHCGLNISDRWQRWKIWLRTRVQYQLVAFCLLFLLAFQEADLAALMQASGWSEWMFSRHVRGLSLATTTRLATVPIVISIPFLVPIVYWLTIPNRDQENVVRQPSTPQVLEWILVMAWMFFALLLVVVIPTWQLVRGVGIGLKSVTAQPSLPQEIGDAMLISVTTTVGVGIVAFGLQRLQKSSLALGWRRFALLLLLIPGSVGNLALGVIVAGIFQTDALNFAYDTPVPLILSEVFFLLPKALILLNCMNRISRPSSVYQVTLLSHSSDAAHQRSVQELRWQLHGWKLFAIACILGLWAYFEVLLPSILAMPGLSPVGLVLYNNLHYGRIAALGAKLAFTLAIPSVLVCAFLLLRRFLSRLSLV